MSQSTPVRNVQAAIAVATGLGLAAVLVFAFGGNAPDGRRAGGPTLNPVADRQPAKKGESAKTKGRKPRDAEPTITVRPAPEFVEKGITWIIKAQHPDGGWGAGSHAHQDVRDPHAVQVDPATTAFVAASLVRSGSTATDGEHKAAVRKATEYLCSVVEKYNKPGPKITDLEGTQIQAKLGPLVDTAMTAQYLARILPTVPKSDSLHARIDKALDKCLGKLNESQQKDGSWNVGGGWASVLQSSLACTAMELAQAAGKDVDNERLDRAREYNTKNFDAKTGATNTEASAGVALYAFSGALRNSVAQAKAADELIEQAKEEGKLAADAPVTAENLKIAGVQPQAAQSLALANFNTHAQNGVLNGSKSYSPAEVAGPAAKPTADVVATATPAPIARPIGVTSESSARIDVDEAVAGPVVSEPTPIPSVASRYSARTYAGETAATTEDALLAGFGNNGGEEFLSYMLAAESMVILSEKDWNNWYDKMGGRLSKVQNPDGSWSGHHCITSPVFCTAAVVQTMTADHDAEMLVRLAKEAAAIAKVDAKQ